MNSLDEPWSRLDEMCLRFAAFRLAEEQMTINLERFRRTGHISHLLILGESGTGKTRLATEFMKRHPGYAESDRDILPILYAAIPPSATMAAMVEVLLEQLGDTHPQQGTVSAKTSRAVKLARACGVEMLLLDEAQHVQDRGRNYTQYFVGDWLKAFIDALAVPAVLIGLFRTRVLLQVNEQLRRRFTREISLQVQDNPNRVDHMESAELLIGFAEAFGLIIDPSPYGWDEFGLRVHFATESRIAYIKQLLTASIDYLRPAQSHLISCAAFEPAFSNAIWSAGVGPTNPFNSEFKFRSLDRVGEPFYRPQVAPAVRQGVAQ